VTIATTDRVPLTRGRIIDAALALVDEQGLGALSMRKLGAALGVEAMSLYNHVANKDDVLDGVVGELLVEVELPDPDDSWPDQLRALAHEFRRVGLAHPGAFLLLGSRPVRSLDGFAPLECAYALLRRAGLEPQVAHDAFHVAAGFVIGFVEMEISGLYEHHEDDVDLLTLPEDRYPNLVELGRCSERSDPATQFDLGLEVLIGGLTQLVARTSR
jgi:AcrR family transcriptional regulator